MVNSEVFNFGVTVFAPLNAEVFYIEPFSIGAFIESGAFKRELFLQSSLWRQCHLAKKVVLQILSDG